MSTPEQAARPLPRITSAWVSTGLVFLASIVLGVRHAWTADDGFITFRVARNIAEGHGPVFNIGERIEASTSPIWTWLMGLLGWINAGHLETLSACIGILLASGGLLLMMRGSQRGVVPDGRLVLPAGVLVLLCLRSFWEFETSGLDISLAVGWVGLAWWMCTWLLTTNDPSRRALLGTVLVLGLAPLVRAELVLAALIVLVVLLRNPALRAAAPRWLAVLVFLAPGAAYQLFRMAYYAVLVPTTALAKEGSHFRFDLVGLNYFWVSLLLSLAFVPALALLVLRRGLGLGDGLGSLRRAFVIGGIVEMVYVVLVGGDYMIGRLLLPGLALLVAPFATVRVSAVAAWRPVALLSVAVVLPAVLQPHLLPNPHDDFGTRKNWLVQEARYLSYQTKVARPYRLSDYGRSYVLKDLSTSYTLYGRIAEPNGRFTELPDPSTQSVVTTSILGLTGYVLPSRVYVIDLNGLADPISSRLHLDRRGRPGHEKRIGDGFARVRFGAQQPTAPPNAKACGQIKRLYRDVRGPLGISQMWRNFWDSFGNTTMRIQLSDNDAVCAPRV